MANQTISIFLPIFFAALVICGIVICTCLYCHRPNARFLSGLSFGRRGHTDGGDPEKGERRKRKKPRKGRKERLPGRPPGRIVSVEQETVAHVSIPGQLPHEGGPASAQHVNVVDADPDAEVINVVDAVHPDID